MKLKTQVGAQDLSGGRLLYSQQSLLMNMDWVKKKFAQKDTEHYITLNPDQSCQRATRCHKWSHTTAPHVFCAQCLFLNKKCKLLIICWKTHPPHIPHNSDCWPDPSDPPVATTYVIRYHLAHSRCAVCSCAPPGRAVFQEATALRSRVWEVSEVGAGKGSRGENHMFTGMLGFVVAEQWEAHCQQHENGGGEAEEPCFRMFMLLIRKRPASHD